MVETSRQHLSVTRASLLMFVCDCLRRTRPGVQSVAPAASQLFAAMRRAPWPDVRRARPPTKTLRGCEAANAHCNEPLLKRLNHDQRSREQESDPAVPAKRSFKKPCPHCQNLRGAERVIPRTFGEDCDGCHLMAHWQRTDSKAVGDTQPTALPSSPSCRFLGRHSLVCRTGQ
jgi:hypothetical protein